MVSFIVVTEKLQIPFYFAISDGFVSVYKLTWQNSHVIITYNHTMFIFI